MVGDLLREIWPGLALIAIFEIVQMIFGRTAGIACGLVVLTGIILFLAYVGDKEGSRP